MTKNLICDIESLADVNKIGASQLSVPASREERWENFLDEHEATWCDEAEPEPEPKPEPKPGNEPEPPLIEDWRDEVLCADTRIDLPPLKPIVSPILNGGETIIIYAKTGMGKSWFALEMAKVISEGGTFLGRYSVETPRRVLYIDGEMGIRTFQERLDKLKINNEYFRYRTCDFPLTCKALDFARTEFQNILIRYVDWLNSEVVFLDNLTTLYITDKTNQQESWAIMQSFILRLRNSGLAVVIVDHAGKGDGFGPRGTSAKTDIMQTVIELQKPASYRDEEGARFNVFFRKHRNFLGPDARPFEAWFTSDGWLIGEVEAENADAETKSKDVAFSMFDEGKTPKEVIGVLGQSKKSSVYGWHKEWEKMKEAESPD